MHQRGRRQVVSQLPKEIGDAINHQPIVLRAEEEQFVFVRHRASLKLV